jgi:hypothetical protein
MAGGCVNLLLPARQKLSRLPPIRGTPARAENRQPSSAILFYLKGRSYKLRPQQAYCLRTLRIAWVVGAAKPQGREEH